MPEANIIDGKQVAAELRESIAARVAEFTALHGFSPTLATVLVGEDAASQIYVRNKHAACEAVGISTVDHRLPADTPPSKLRAVLEELNADNSIHGILLQLPLPSQLDANEMTSLIDVAKDVDGLTPLSAGLLAQGRPCLVPCTPSGVIKLLDHQGVQLQGANAVVVGRSNLVGKPLAALLLARNATVTVCHSKTRDLAAACRSADVLIAAVGIPQLITVSMVSAGAVVIDVGMNRLDDGLVGDVEFDAVAPVASAITPVPGGVGPMTIACLLDNTLKAATALERVAA